MKNYEIVRLEASESSHLHSNKQDKYAISLGCYVPSKILSFFSFSLQSRGQQVLLVCLFFTAVMSLKAAMVWFQDTAYVNTQINNILH